MTAGQRRAIGGFGLVAYLVVYLVLALELAARLPLDSPWAQLVFYPIAGIVWALPLRPAMRWMLRADPEG